MRWILAACAILLLGFAPLSCRRYDLKVGSKKFTESVILGEMFAQLAQRRQLSVNHKAEMGGTRYVFNALERGTIDVYPEYSGTLIKEIFAGQQIKDLAQLRRTLAQRGIEISQPLGFNNTYAIGMRRDRAEELGIEKISDLSRYPNLRLGFTNEFMDRADGWPGLRQRYLLPQQDVRGLDHDIAYRELQLGTKDAIDVYTTDAKIVSLDLRLLRDDLNYFPRYDAMILFRHDLRQRHPGFVDDLLRIESNISAEQMTRLNHQVELQGESAGQAAAGFLADRFQIAVVVPEPSVMQRVWRHTVEHFNLVRHSLIPAVLVAIPLGIFAARFRRVGQLILGAVGIVQTIPALALLVILFAPVVAVLASIQESLITQTDVTTLVAIAALFLYSLLPIVRNTYSGLQDIQREYLDSAIAIGLPNTSRLLRIELPMASRTILAGIKTAAVLNVGFAALGALIGAGGYGQPILTGIRLDDTALILQGAIPAAAMALGVQWAFDLSERFIVPRGMRLRPAAEG